ncbi:MAG: hypothetical protein AB7O45_07535 [Alphaproteobacteria bacterium]
MRTLLLAAAMAAAVAGCETVDALARPTTAAEFCADPANVRQAALWRRLCDAPGLAKPAPTDDPGFCARADHERFYPFWWRVLCAPDPKRRAAP